MYDICLRFWGPWKIQEHMIFLMWIFTHRPQAIQWDFWNPDYFFPLQLFLTIVNLLCEFQFTFKINDLMILKWRLVYLIFEYCLLYKSTVILFILMSIVVIKNVVLVNNLEFAWYCYCFLFHFIAMFCIILYTAYCIRCKTTLKTKYKE